MLWVDLQLSAGHALGLELSYVAGTQGQYVRNQIHKALHAPIFLLDPNDVPLGLQRNTQ